MARIHRYIVGLLAMLPLAPASAVDWQVTSQSTEQVRMIDLDTVTTSKGYVKAWTMITYWSEKTTLEYPRVNYRSVKFLTYFNCRERTAFSPQTVYYAQEAGEGEVRHSHAAPVRPADFVDVVPGTVGETDLQTACALTRSARKRP